jgi:hypothetical protein
MNTSITCVCSLRIAKRICERFNVTASALRIPQPQGSTIVTKQLYARYAQLEPGKLGWQSVTQYREQINGELSVDAVPTMAADADAAKALRVEAINLELAAGNALAEIDGSKERDMAESPYSGGYIDIGGGMEMVEAKRI